MMGALMRGAMSWSDEDRGRQALPMPARTAKPVPQAMAIVARSSSSQLNYNGLKKTAVG